VRIVSLIASATEIVCALGYENSLVGRSHECDFPPSVRSLPVLTRPRFDPLGTSREIDQRVKEAARILRLEELLDRSEIMTRKAIEAIPDGTYSYADTLDNDGIDLDVPIRLFVTITKQGDTMTFDWTGSADQVKGAINNTLSFTKAASYTAARSILPDNGDLAFSSLNWEEGRAPALKRG